MSSYLTIMDSLTLLAGCLCDQVIADNEEDTLCFCGVLPGNGVPLDVGTCRSGCGMAYVRLVSSYAATEVGVLNLEPGNCSMGQGFDLEVGIFRCFPIAKDGKSPKPDVLYAKTQQQLNDMVTMRTALNCCEWLDDSKAFVIGQYVPAGPQGGVLGGVFPVSAWLP